MLPSFYLRSDSDTSPLRIGLLVNSSTLPACFAAVVEQIQQSNFASVELVVYNAEQTGAPADIAPKRSWLGRLAGRILDGRRRKTMLFELYERWDRRNIKATDNPRTPIDCSTKFARSESLRVTPVRTRFVHRFPADAVERIREKNLDVLIRFGFNILRGDILTAAKHGVWSYHHGDGDAYRGGPPYFWEIREGNPLSGVMLQVLTEDLDAGKVLCKGLFATHDGISRARNSVQPYWGAVTFVIQKLRELHQHGWAHVERTAVAPAPYRGKTPIYRSPSNYEMICWLGPLLARRSLRRLVRQCAPKIEHWRLAIRSGRRLTSHPGAPADLGDFRWIESPRGHFYAGPFLIEERGKVWIYFEDYDYATRTGSIACAQVDGNEISEPVTVLERPYHLSYPCIFRAENGIYMIPETSGSGAVELYRCTHFPDQWKFEKELFKARTVDTTVWIEEGIYWFFTTIKGPNGSGSQLWLFYATTLTGEWIAHPNNPISTDVRNCRGAGAIFKHDGKLFRPSQDCSKTYGYSFTLNEIVCWDRDRYQEKPGVTIEPQWSPNLMATHSYSQAGEFEVIDGQTLMPVAAVLNTP